MLHKGFSSLNKWFKLKSKIIYPNSKLSPLSDIYVKRCSDNDSGTILWKKINFLEKAFFFFRFLYTLGSYDGQRDPLGSISYLSLLVIRHIQITVNEMSPLRACERQNIPTFIVLRNSKHGIFRIYRKYRVKIVSKISRNICTCSDSKIWFQV